MKKETKTKSEVAFKDVKMSWTDDDIEKIQNKPNLYLMQYGDLGCNHLGKEIVQNAYDEVLDDNSPGKEIWITFDKKFNKLTVEDDGRGFPENDYSLDIFVTKLQSGSKSNRSQSGSTSGELTQKSELTLNSFNCWKLLRA